MFSVALISADDVYQLSKTPVLQHFNHVIVYVPAIDRYLDPTVTSVSFERLPLSEIGKPVVRVSEGGATLARTPAPSGTVDNVLTLKTHFTIAPDGRQQAKTRIKAGGEFADELRAFTAQVESKGKDAVMANLAAQRGLYGRSTVDASPAADTGEPVIVNTIRDGEQQADVVQAGWAGTAALKPASPRSQSFLWRFDIPEADLSSQVSRRQGRPRFGYHAADLDRAFSAAAAAHPTHARFLVGGTLVTRGGKSCAR